MKMMSCRRWTWLLAALVLVPLAILAALVFVVDPYFHYRAPALEMFGYVLDNERFQNDGIVKHFKYQAMIVGSSMAENFLPSQFEKLFGSKTIKTTMSGACYREMRDLVQLANRRNPDLEYAVVAIDGNKMMSDPARVRYDLGLAPT